MTKSYLTFKLLGMRSVAILGLMLGPPAVAGQNSGTVLVDLVLEPGCVVNQDTGPTANFGIVDFGTVGPSFGEQTALLTGSEGQGIAVACSAGVTAKLSVLGGLHDAGGGAGYHAMAQASGNASHIPYSLYTDSGRTQVLHNHAPIPLVFISNATQRIDIYARAFSVAGIAAGQYSDMLTFQLDF